MHSGKDGFAARGDGAAYCGGEVEQESGFEGSELGVPSDTMWRPRRNPRSSQPLSPLGGSYADMGQKLPEKGCDLGGAVRWKGTCPQGWL